MATQKIEMGRNGRDTDYESKKRAALAQSDSNNDYMWGMQSVYQNGTGAASKASRSTAYGNVNFTTGDHLDGANGVFKPRSDDAGNQLLSDPLNTTGFVDGQTSMTINPQVDPEVAGAEMQERVVMMARGMQHPGLNNRAQTMRA